MAAMTTFITFVFVPVAYSPMTFLLAVAQNRGMTAKGIPTERSTWLHTRLIVGSAPQAIMRIAGMRAVSYTHLTLPTNREV